jgi:hypothetical protein
MQATFLPGNGLAEFAAHAGFHHKKAYEVFPLPAFSKGLTKTAVSATGGHPHSAAVKAFFNAAFMVVMMRFTMKYAPPLFVSIANTKFGRSSENF